MSRTSHAFPLALAIAMGCALATMAPAVHAQSLLNLTPDGATLADGNKACPDQPYYLYAGGKPDAYAPAPDFAYPSVNLDLFIPHNRPVVMYDTPQMDNRFGDSFNLQNTRSVCYAVIEYRVKSTNGGSTNDGLTFGHVGAGGAPFDIVGQVINPAGSPGVHHYALDATGRVLLGTQTGMHMDKAPADSIFDLYLQDDTAIDYFKLYVWYGPTCQQQPNQPGC